MTQPDQITPEQSALIDKDREEWVQNGLSSVDNNPCNRKALEDVLTKLYARQSKPQPKFYWADSPFAACLAAPLLVSKNMPAIPVVDTMDAKKAEGVTDQRSLLKAIQKSLVRQIMGPEEEITKEFLGDWQKGAQLAFNCRWSGWWCGYMVHCHILNTHGALTLEKDVREHLDLWVELYRHLHMMFVFEDFVIFSERPVSIHRNDNNRLHSTTAPALLYRDGYALYAVNGVRVPEKAVMAPDTYTFKELQEEKNSEVHRVIAENLGWDKYIEKIQGKVVSKFFCEKFMLEYELLESTIEVGDLQPKYLRMRSPKLWDQTSPWFIEPVHPELQTAQAARKWQFMLSKDPNAKMVRQGDVFICYAPPESMYWPEPSECNANPVLVFEAET